MPPSCSDELVATAGADPTSVSLRLLPYPDTRRFWAQLGDTEQGPSRRSSHT